MINNKAYTLLGFQTQVETWQQMCSVKFIGIVKI